MVTIQEETAVKMRSLLASLTVFYQKTHVYHWDLVGRSFNQLHAFFEELYNEAVKNTDAVAERLRQANIRTNLSLTEAVRLSGVEDNVSAESDEEMVTDLIRSLAILTALQTEIFMEANDANDYVTADLMTQLTKQADFNSWFLTSWKENR